MLDLEIKDFAIEKRLVGCEYLGAGASKEAYYDKERNVVIKVPRGRQLIVDSGIGFDIKYPDTMNGLNDMLSEINKREHCLVWPLGQFVTEIIVWNALKELEEEYDISNFAEIYDAYLDKNGVIVIEQEPATDDYIEDEELKVIEYEIRDVLGELESRYDIALDDIRTENAGYNREGILKIFDYGLSSYSDIRDYGSYSCYDDDYDYSYDNSSEEEENSYNSDKEYNYKSIEEEKNKNEKKYNYEAVIIINKNADTGACRDKYEMRLREESDEVVVEDLGLRKLAYEIKGNDEGYYVLYRFNKASVAAIEEELRKDDDIIKFIFIRIGE